MTNCETFNKLCALIAFTGILEDLDETIITEEDRNVIENIIYPELIGLEDEFGELKNVDMYHLFLNHYKSIHHESV